MSCAPSFNVSDVVTTNLTRIQGTGLPEVIRLSEDWLKDNRGAGVHPRSAPHDPKRCCVVQR